LHLCTFKCFAFAGAVVQAGLLDAANNPAIQKTVFGPNNAAFAAVASVVAALTPEQVCNTCNM
jgi:hypothetical protein